MAETVTEEGASGFQQDLVELVERPSPPPDSAVALRQGTAGSVKRLQANGMKPTIIEDSETSDEDAIIRLDFMNLMGRFEFFSF